MKSDRNPLKRGGSNNRFFGNSSSEESCTWHREQWQRLEDVSNKKVFFFHFVLFLMKEDIISFVFGYELSECFITSFLMLEKTDIWEFLLLVFKD